MLPSLTLIFVCVVSTGVCLDDDPCPQNTNGSISTCDNSGSNVDLEVVWSPLCLHEDIKYTFTLKILNSTHKTVSFNSGLVSLSVRIPGFERPVYEYNENHNCTEGKAMLSKMFPFVVFMQCPFILLLNTTITHNLQHNFTSLPVPMGSYEVRLKLVDNTSSEYTGLNLCIHGWIVVACPEGYGKCVKDGTEGNEEGPAPSEVDSPGSQHTQMHDQL